MSSILGKLFSSKTQNQRDKLKTTTKNCQIS